MFELYLTFEFIQKVYLTHKAWTYKTIQSVKEVVVAWWLAPTWGGIPGCVLAPLRRGWEVEVVGKVNDFKN